MRHQGTIELFQYWNRLRGARPAPRRTEIEPADIKALLADTFILERDMRGEAVFRLAGTRLCATYGRELKGFSFPSLWSQPDQKLIGSLAYGTFSAKNIAVVAFEGMTRGGRTLDFELILLPLDGEDQNGRTLGVATPESKPIWLGADPIAENRVSTVRIIDPEREAGHLRPRQAIPVPSLMPADTAFERADSDHGRRIRHLVVFNGGRDG